MKQTLIIKVKIFSYVLNKLNSDYCAGLFKYSVDGPQAVYLVKVNKELAH